MKMLLLEQDKTLAEKIMKEVNATRISVDFTYFQEEKEIYEHIPFLHEYDLFILNLENPINTRLKSTIKENGGDAPILLILEKDVQPKMLKTIYYLAYNDIIIKDFIPESITFRIYKLCNLWNDNIFFIAKDIYFDFKYINLLKS